MATAVMLAACGSESDSKTAEPNVSAPKVVDALPPMPSIYIDQTITPATSVNRKELYADLLGICQEEGVPITPLKKSEAEKIGTIRLQRWMDATRTAYRLESWDYRLADPQDKPHCHFHLISSGRHVLIEGNKLRGVELDKNKSYEITPLPTSDASLLLRTPTRDNISSADEQQIVAGQRCIKTKIRSADSAEVCTWSGGMDWGFKPRSMAVLSVSDMNHYSFFRSLILQQNPVGNKQDKVTTNVFTITNSLDESAIQPARATALPAQQSPP